MPELPEVETIARSLSPGLCGRRFVAVDVYERRLRHPVAPGLTAALAGRRVVAVGRRGKYVLCELDDGRIWAIHLGMSGRLTLMARSEPRRRHDHLIAYLDDGRALYYHDPRRFGSLVVMAPGELASLGGGGVDALDPAFTPGFLRSISRGRRRTVKALLMDQAKISGIGNIYANEILFRAGIDPRSRAGGLTQRECRAIVSATRSVLRAAIAQRGTSIADYRDGRGRAGRFQRRLRVYGRAGAPCPRCNARIRKIIVAGRGTFHCPRCQR